MLGARLEARIVGSRNFAAPRDARWSLHGQPLRPDTGSGPEI